MKKFLLFGAFISVIFASEQTELIKKLYEPYIKDDYEQVEASSAFFTDELKALFKKATIAPDSNLLVYDPIINNSFTWNGKVIEKTLQISQNEGNKVVASFKLFEDYEDEQSPFEKVEFNLVCDNDCKISDITNYDYKNKPIPLKESLKTGKELIQAIKNNNTDKFNEIIAKKPDFSVFSVVDENGYSACDLAILHKDSFYSEMFFSDLIKADGCVIAKKENKILDIMSLFTEAQPPDFFSAYKIEDFDVNQSLPSGLKIIHLVCMFGAEGDIEMLIKSGADIKATVPSSDDTQNDCLYFAAIYNQGEGIIDYLADKGFDLNKTYFHGSALIQASRHNNQRASYDLIKRGADVNASTPVGGSAFTFLAGFNDSSWVLKKLAKMGAELNAGIDGFGGTALDRAVLYSDDFEVVDTLLALGAGDKDKALCTLAVAAKDGKMIDYLVDLGAKLNDDCDEEDFMFGDEDLSIERLEWLEKNSKIKISDKLRKEALSPKN